MKTIIQRNLPLDVRYTVIDKKYIPIMDGGGCTCANCGKLIANIATVRSDKGTYNIGFDCMETFLLNNQLLDGFSVDDLKKVRGMITKSIRFSKELKKIIQENPQANITGIIIEPKMFEFSDWITYYILTNNHKKSRDNHNIKLKGIGFGFMVETMRSIFPKLEIIVRKVQ